MERGNDDRLFGFIFVGTSYAALLVAAFQFLTLPTFESKALIVGLAAIGIVTFVVVGERVRDVGSADLPLRYWVLLVVGFATLNVMLGRLAADMGIDAISDNERGILGGLTLGTAWLVSLSSAYALAKKRGALVRIGTWIRPQPNRPVLFDLPWRRRRHPG